MRDIRKYSIDNTLVVERVKQDHMIHITEVNYQRIKAQIFSDLRECAVFWLPKTSKLYPWSPVRIAYVPL